MISVELFGTSSASRSSCAVPSAASPSRQQRDDQTEMGPDESRIGLQHLLEQLERLLIASGEVVNAAESETTTETAGRPHARAASPRKRDRGVRARRETSRTSAAWHVPGFRASARLNSISAPVQSQSKRYLMNASDACASASASSSSSARVAAARARWMACSRPASLNTVGRDGMAVGEPGMGQRISG